MISTQQCKYVPIEALEQFFSGNRFDLFLSELAYAWDVEELGGSELGQVGVLITKARLLAVAEDLGVLDSTIEALKANLPDDTLIDLVPVEVMAHDA